MTNINFYGELRKTLSKKSNFNYDFSKYENKEIIGNKFEVDFNERLMNVMKSWDEVIEFLKDEK